MDDFESKLGSILNNPEMMGRIMEMAQSFGGQSAQPEPPPAQESSFPELDFATMQKISRLLGNTGVDNEQKALLAALAPYVSGNRIGKLERAMRAAKMASMAGILTGKSPSGR